MKEGRVPKATTDVWKAPTNQALSGAPGIRSAEDVFHALGLRQVLSGLRVTQLPPGSSPSSRSRTPKTIFLS